MVNLLEHLIHTAHAAVEFHPGAAAEPKFVSLTHIDKLTQKGNLPELLSNLFLITIGLAAVLGVIMIAVGGIQYMGSDSFHMKGQGRERMQNALLGLFIILASYLILNTINPNLLNLNIIVPSGQSGIATQNQLILFEIPHGQGITTNMFNICKNAGGTWVEHGNATACAI